MNNPLYSSEIRWFSQDRHFLHRLYADIPGKGRKESERTDYYLKYQGIDTGVKIRQGRHEIKVKNANNEHFQKRVIEHWTKWSTKEERNILNTIAVDHLSQWLPIKKERSTKIFLWNKSTGKMEYTEGFPDDGCGVEYTILQVRGQNWYTFGLEAFGTYRSCKENLLAALDFLNLPDINNKEYWNFGYPRFISELLKSK